MCIKAVVLLVTSRKNILEGKEENIFEFTQDMQREETCRFALYIIHTEADPNGKKFKQLFSHFTPPTKVLIFMSNYSNSLKSTRFFTNKLYYKVCNN